MRHGRWGRSYAVGMVVLLVAAAGSWGFGLVTGGMGAEALGAKIEEWNNELRAEANDAATRAKLFERLREARESLMPIKETNTRNVGLLEQRLTQLRAEHEGDPAGWPAADRAEYERTADARERLARAETGLTAAWDNLKWLQGRQNVEGFDPFRNETFKERFAQLGEQVTTVATEFGEFNATYNVETADRADENSHPVVVPASRVTIRNTSDGMMFIVNGTNLGPGAAEAEVRLGDHRGLTVRAVGFDDKRRQLRTVRDRLEQGGGQARLFEIDAAALYLIRYGTDQLTTRMAATRESYRWTWGTAVTRAIGQTSPWAPGGPVIVEPELSASAETRVDDTFRWWVPAVEEATVTFTFSANASVAWATERTRDGRSLGVTEDTLLSDGSLEVTVEAR